MPDLPLASSRDAEEPSAVWHAVYEIGYRIARVRFHFVHHDAEDIGQEMAMRSLEKVREGTINTAWVARGAAYLCIDRIRNRASEAEALHRYTIELTSLAMHNGLRHRLLATDVERCIERLRPPCRELLRHHFWEGMTWAEIDAMVSEGRRTSQQRASRCLQALLTELGRMFGEEDDHALAKRVLR